ALEHRNLIIAARPPPACGRTSPSGVCRSCDWPAELLAMLFSHRFPLAEVGLLVYNPAKSTGPQNRRISPGGVRFPRPDPTRTSSRRADEYAHRAHRDPDRDRAEECGSPGAVAA